MNSLKETKLFGNLQDGYLRQEGELATKISSVVEDLCEKASTRMNKSIVLHKEYTLHNETHLLRVTEIMGMILGDNGINRLNDKLGCHEVTANSINLTPGLLKN